MCMAMAAADRMGSAVVRGEAEAVSPHVRDGLSDESDHVFAGGVEWIEWIGLDWNRLN